MKQINSVLFDLGNVLAYINFDMFWRSLGYFNPESRTPFSSGYKALTLQYETGLIPTDDYLKGLYSVFNQRFTIAQLEHAFADIIREPIEGMADIVKRVSRAHQTALVSNTNEIHIRISLTKFDVLHDLHKHYLSYQLHVMKPAKGFYEAIIKNLGIHPSEILFIDDIAENVAAAKDADLQALKFEGPAQLENTLKILGVL